MNSQTALPYEKPIELIIHNVHEHGVDILEMWMKEIEVRTEGRILFKKTTGEDPQAIQAADLVRDVPVAGDRYPLLNLIQIPFIFSSSTIGSRVIAQLYSEFSELRSELNDVKIIGLGTGALLGVFSSKSWGPIRTMGDFKNARTRSLPMIDDVVQAFGAQPQHVGWFDMAPLLATGGLDAVILGVLPAHMFKLEDGTAPYCTLTKRSITMHPMRLYMKWDSWNHLPPDICKIFDEIGPAGFDCWYAVQSGIDADTHLNEALDYIKQKAELIEISQRELERWQMMVIPVTENILSSIEAKGLPARQFYNRMIELVERLA
jgi:TRAP-type transport system periplasmic protein